MLAVGKELLIGRTLNSNALWLGKRLARMGSILKEITTIDDDLSEIGLAIRSIIGRSPEFLVVVGGLGPTPDDMTLRGVADALGVELKHSEAALKLIREHYASRGLDKIELTPPRLKMARLPASAEPVMNEVGTAPGVRLVTGSTIVYCLPGVPAEMRSIFRRSVEPEIRKRLGKTFKTYITMKLEGILESAIAPIIGEELRRHPEAYIKSHPRGIKEGVSRLELDIAVVGKEKEPTQKEGVGIAQELEKRIVGAGGRIMTVKGMGKKRRRA